MKPENRERERESVIYQGRKELPGDQGLGSLSKQECDKTMTDLKEASIPVMSG